MPWVWAPRTSSGYGAVSVGSDSLSSASTPICGPLPWQTISSCSRGERGEGLCGLPDVPALDLRVRALAALQQRVAAEGDHDAHAQPASAATSSALMVCIRFSAWSNTTDAGTRRPRR